MSLRQHEGAGPVCRSTGSLAQPGCGIAEGNAWWMAAGKRNAGKAVRNFSGVRAWLAVGACREHAAVRDVHAGAMNHALGVTSVSFERAAHGWRRDGSIISGSSGPSGDRSRGSHLSAAADPNQRTLRRPVWRGARRRQNGITSCAACRSHNGTRGELLRSPRGSWGLAARKPAETGRLSQRLMPPDSPGSGASRCGRELIRRCRPRWPLTEPGETVRSGGSSQVRDVLLQTSDVS